MADIKLNVSLGNDEKVDKLRKELKIEMDKSNGKST